MILACRCRRSIVRSWRSRTSLTGPSSQENEPRNSTARFRRFATALFAASILAATLQAQTASRAQLQPITGPIKDAGVYHLGVGTWTRASHVAFLVGPDVIYNNTCSNGYFGAQGFNETWSDEGRLPSTTGPVDAPNENFGCSNAYTIDAFQIAYCTNVPAPYKATIGFQDHYTTCAVPSPTHAFALTALPGGTGGMQGCWLVTIDLTASSQSFTLLADGTGGFPGGDAVTNHLFGWQFTTNVQTHPNTTGPVIAGHFPLSSTGPCSGVDGTRWDTIPGAPPPTWPNNPEEGTGMDTQAQFRIDNNQNVASGCYFFGGNVLGSFHLRLFANTGCPASQPGGDDCIPGVGSVVGCPCMNPQAPAGSTRGCNNSSSTGGAILLSVGAPSLASDTLVFHAMNEQFTASSILLQGSAFNASGVVFGQGVRCASGNLLRLYVHTADGGSVAAPAGGDPSVSARSAALGDLIAAGSMRQYLMYYRDPTVLGGCPSSSTFNATQGQSISWMP
jgi:hypothetical protein